MRTVKLYDAKRKGNFEKREKKRIEEEAI